MQRDGFRIARPLIGILESHAQLDEKKALTRTNYSRAIES